MAEEKNKISLYTLVKKSCHHLQMINGILTYNLHS